MAKSSAIREMERKKLWTTSDNQAGDEQIRRRSDQGDNQGNRPDDIKRSVSSSIGRPVVNER